MLFNYLRLTDVTLFLALQTWECPIIRGEGPEAREGHSAAVVGQRLFIFGGCGKSADNNNEVYYNDLYILNTGTFPSSYHDKDGY
jgi:hypothetical protein